MYQKLLLNCDGGIIDEAYQSDQDNCAIVCVGLGGTGVDCLKNLKTKIYNRVKPDNPDSSVPEYSHIKFLAVDTDKSGLEKANRESTDISKIDLSTEFFDLSFSGDISDLFKNNKANLDTDPDYKEWLEYTKIKAQSAKAGAGGVRQLGRYLFIEHAKEFKARISSLITQAKTNLDEPKTYVHIFSGISGGTGAGTFLDVCYLIRDAIKDNKTDSFLCGYFFLPDVNISNGIDRETEAYVKVNGYASLQELDYCMNFEENGDKWSQRYSGIKLIESQKPPVDICHLVSARDANGNIIKDAYNYAMNVVTDYFMDFVIKTKNNFTMESHISNYTNKKANVEKKHGANYEYCVLGAACGTLPYKEVLTYLSSKMFAQMSSVKNNLPSKNMLESFIKINNLEYGSIYAKLIQGCNLTFPFPDVKWSDEAVKNDLTANYFANLRAETENIVSANFSAMTRDIQSYDPAASSDSGAVRSLITIIYNALRAEAINPEKGPFYAAALLRSTLGVDLIATVDGQLAEARSKYGQEVVKDGTLRTAWQDLQNDFFTKPKRKKYEKYRDAARDLALHHTKCTILNQMINLLTVLRNQLVALANNFMDIFKNTVDNLINTFDANNSYLEDLSDSETAYEIPIVSVNDPQLKNNMDLTIQQMDINAKTKDFFTVMLSSSGIRSWQGNNENEIFKFVNNYFTTLFSDYSHKTITSYLQEKYNTVNTAQLIKNIHDDIMNTLDRKSTPMFWTSASYDVNDASKIGYVTFPAISAEIAQAANQLSEEKDNGELTTRNSHVHDRISIMRCLVGVPLFGYQGLLQYESNSIMNPAVGKHLYEGRNFTNDEGKYVKGRDWRYLPSPISFSLMNDENCEILRNDADKAKKLYEKAEEKGVITQTSANDYGIRTLTPSFTDSINSIGESALNKTNADKLQAIDDIKAKMTAPEFFPDAIPVPNDATSALPEFNKRIVRIDHFVSSPKLQKIVIDELAVYDKIDALLAELEPKIDNDLVSYQKALFTGVILFDPNEDMKYEDEFGEEYMLSHPSMKRGGAPLYQAMLSFKELEQDIKDQIDEKAELVLRSRPDESAKDNCRAVWEELKSPKGMIKLANNKFPSEVNDLKKFLADMKEELEDFAFTYKFKLEQK